MSAVALGFALVAAFAPAAESLGPKAFTRFVEKYCLQCHDAQTQKGDREFETFKLPLATEAALVDAKDIIDQITLREMPPRKAEVFPTDDERLAVIRVLREGIACYIGNGVVLSPSALLQEIDELE